MAGVLGLTTSVKVRQFSNLPEVTAMRDPILDVYINRAEFIISRMYDYDNTLSGYVQYMEYAADMLTENLVVMNTPQFRRSSLAKLIAESIGTYSYKKGTPGANAQDPNAALTEEIMGMLKAYTLGNTGVPFSTTLVFVRRSESFDNTGIKYAVPDDITTDILRQDPAIPDDSDQEI